MNVLFLSLGTFYNLNDSSVHLDILKKFAEEHNVWLACKNENRPTELSEELGIHVLRIHTGELKKIGLLKKGINTIKVEPQFKNAIKKHFSNVKFDLVIYTTPPITFVSAIRYIKNRDEAYTYLLLKDIFPQNAVDLGMLSTNGFRGWIYRFFRNKEKELYRISDKIGCMSQANVDYILEHNCEIPKERLEVCPNAIDIKDMSITNDERNEIREKYGIPLDKKVFVYGGNLGKPQGIPFIIECLRTEKDNADAYFLIVGDGTEYGKLETFVNEEKPANVKLMKRLPKDDYDRMIAACDVGMIFLDHRFTIPNFPSRLLSYMQAGIPVLACTDPNTDIGKVITEGGFGWWCESDDIRSFKKLIELINKTDISYMRYFSTQFLMDNYSVERAYSIILQGLSSECTY